MTNFTYISAGATNSPPRARSRAGAKKRTLRAVVCVTLVSVLVSVGGAALIAAATRAPALQDGEPSPIFGVTIPRGYRDWRLISVAHEAGDLDDLRAVLGNDMAIEAYRQGKRALPDGAIIARLAWRNVASEENNKAFGREQSFVAGPATNVQFMVKDSLKYSATGGWGYGQFEDGRPGDAAVHSTCAACHAKTPDAVFTHYAR
jgi:hypothetical protein